MEKRNKDMTIKLTQQDRLTLLCYEYENFVKLNDHLNEAALGMETIGSAMFEDFSGISKIGNAQNLLAEEMNNRINFIYGLDYETDLFIYFLYEASNMTDGGKIVNESGKEYPIRTFNDLLIYLESEYGTSKD